MPFKALIKHSLFESDTLNNLIFKFILEVSISKSLHTRNDKYFRRPDKYHQPPLKSH